MRGLLGSAGLVAALLSIGGLLAPSAPGFAVVDATAGRVVVCRSLPPPERVALVFTHSMYGGDVVEEFVVTPEQTIRRVDMTTENAAAAEYYASTGDVVRVGDRFRVVVPDADFPAIAVRVGRIGGQRLRFGAESVDLLAIAGDRHQVWLRPRSPSLADRLVGDRC